MTAPRRSDVEADPLKLVIVGHVDHGKSTLIGRLIHDTGSLPDGKLEEIEEMSRRRGMAFEWSFLMDALQAERDQGITIDTTQIRFKTRKRPYVIIDAPGHREFLKNMITGAAEADAAFLLIDAEEGVREQTRRHALLLQLLGIRQMAVLVNKMDRVAFDEARFREIEAEVRGYLSQLGLQPDAVIPLSARHGDMLAARSEKIGWYGGPTVLEALDRFRPAASTEAFPLRFTVQDVYKFDERRIIAGRLLSGRLEAGDTLLLSPSGMRVKLKSIERWPQTGPLTAEAGESVGLIFEEQIFCERGYVISHENEAPLLSNRLEARIFWLGAAPFSPGKRYRLKIGAQSFVCEPIAIRSVIDSETLQGSDSGEVLRHQIAEVELRLRGLAALDDARANPATGRFVLFDGEDIAGGGVISLSGIQDQRVEPRVVKSANLTTHDRTISIGQRAIRNGHRGGILWFTGLSGSGKSTLASELERRMFEKGYQIYVLDGDNIRQGLNADLGFSPAERSENIRRVGEVAALFAHAGMLVISAFISPYREDRNRARAAAPEMFHTVYIEADVATCESRDVKGLYKKARAGKLPDFTGVSAPYEAPENPELTLDTMNHSVEECIRRLIDYVERQFGL